MGEKLNVSADLPYGGDLHKAMLAQDRAAIQLLMAIRDTAPASRKPQPAPAEKEKAQCSICLETFDSANKDNVKRSCRVCNSQFHQQCLAAWCNSQTHLKLEEKPWLTASQIESGSCPMCRSDKGHEKSRRWKGK